MSSRLIAALGVLLFWIGCNQRLVLPVVTKGSTSGGSSNGGTTAALETSGNSGSGTGGSSVTGTGTDTGSGTSGLGTGASTGTATGGGTTSVYTSPYGDGGYVLCSAAGGGPGPVHWLCQPGTYFCDPGSPGSCVQCRSDGDCSNQAFPTYDPNRPRCDLDSGVPGFQNFCQQCTGNADCASNPEGTLCDLNPGYPPGAQQPTIEDTGFESCTGVQTDCRLDGGPDCRIYNEFCDATDGQCVANTGACQTDKDCVGVTSPDSRYLPAPFCMGGTCSSCDGGGICPELVNCSTDADCRNPSGAASGMTCDTVTSWCSCANSSQCDAFWPACLPTMVQGQLGDYCGCYTDSQCGDAGLKCLTGSSSGSVAGMCGIPCDAPSAWPCAPYACDADSGTCIECTTDAQCKADPQSSGPFCAPDPPASNLCGCHTKDDCPPGDFCQVGYAIGTCIAELPRCTPGSCAGGFCDWDSGGCVPTAVPYGSGSCIDDYDCANQLGNNSRAPYCQNGECVMCRSNADCLHAGLSAEGGSKCCLPGDKVCQDRGFANNTCSGLCDSDQDCIGNYYGPSCTVGDAGLTPRCGCADDSDCTNSRVGLRCDREPSSVFFGTCTCQIDSDCPTGLACGNFIGDNGQCPYECFADAGCAPGYTCDPGSTCRPRCDGTHSCEEPDLVCDQSNQVGQNDTTNLGPDPAVTWCYGCLTAADCAGGVGCDPEVGCGSCRQSSDCPAGKACIDGGVCQPMCADGGCALGEVCDTYGVAGYGPNVCFECASPADCPNGEGCDSQSHTCGSCEGPTAEGAPFDCPPDAVCSNYWKPTEPAVAQSSSSGVCLTNCDRQSCPADQPICAVLPGLTPDHKYCFGCLTDSDCADAGPGAYCNVSPAPTFTCRLPAGQ